MKSMQSIGRSKDFSKIVNRFIAKLKLEYEFSEKEIVLLLSKAEEQLERKEVLIPITIYKNKDLGILEATCKYMKEELDLSYHKIGELLNRDERAIWTTYNAAKEKQERRIISRPTKMYIPASIFGDRDLSVLEALVKYLRDKFGLRYSEIARVIKRDQRNVWAVCNK